MNHPSPAASNPTLADDDIQQLLRLADSPSFSYRSLFQLEASRTALERWPLLKHMELVLAAKTPAQGTPAQKTMAQTPAAN